MDGHQRTLTLEACLERLAQGESIAACLARYPEQAEELAPLLAAASRFQAVSTRQLSASQRRTAQATLAAAMAARRRAAAPQRRPWLGGLAFASLAALLIGSMTVTGLAASAPGEAAYRLRVLAERVPALLRTSAAAGAMHELRIAERRLADLDAYLAATGQLETSAVDALLAGDVAATARAERLTAPERAAVADRVIGHAQALSALAATASAPDGVALQAAADEARNLAATLHQPPPPELEPRAPGATPAPTATAALPDVPTYAAATPTRTPEATDTARPTVTATQQPTRQPATNTPEAPTATPAATASPLAPGRRATAQALTPAATGIAATPTPEATPQPAQPGRRATVLAQTATVAVSPTPPQPQPGHRATAIAGTATAAPAISPTPLGAAGLTPTAEASPLPQPPCTAAPGCTPTP